MERQAALTLTIIFFVLFASISYYGARVTAWSSIIFGLFVSLILLNIFYPASQVTSDNADFTLLLYALFILIALIFISVYVTQRTLSDIRC